LVLPARLELALPKENRF